MMDDTSNHFVEKKIIEELFPQIKIAHEAMMDSVNMIQEMEDLASSSRDRNIQIRTIKETSCFRIVFGQPVLLLFHESTSLLKGRHIYYKKDGMNFVGGILPTYNMNLNHLTALRTYGKTFDWIPKSFGDVADEYFCKKLLSVDGKRLEQSSLNFILQNDADSFDVLPQISNVINEYFQRFYWHLPSEATKLRFSTIHSIVYHNTYQIYAAHKIYKTLARILEIGSKAYEYAFYPKKVLYRNCKAIVLLKDRSDLIHKEISFVAAEPDASRLSPGMLISGIFVDPWVIQSIYSPPFMLVGLTREIDEVEKWKQILCLSCWMLTTDVNHKKICEVGTADKVYNFARQLFYSNSELFDDTFIESKLKYYMEHLFPMMLESDGIIYHVPPSLMSYMLGNDLQIPQKQDLVKFLQFVDAIHINKGRVFKVRTSEIGEEIQKGPYRHTWGKLLSDLPKVVNRVIYSRVFARSPENMEK